MATKKERANLKRLSVGAFLGLLTGGAVVAVGDHEPRNAQRANHRALQTGSNIVWIDPLEISPTELQVQWKSPRPAICLRDMYNMEYPVLCVGDQTNKRREGARGSLT